MPRKSNTDNVRKRCDCAKWKDCAHPWHIDYRDGKELRNGKLRVKGLRKRLSLVTGREPLDFTDAKNEARRAIVAWKDGRDARDLQPSDRVSLAMLLTTYEARPGASGRETYQAGPITNTVVNGRKFGEWRADEITREMVEAFRQQRPTVAGNRDLALLRAMFNWAVLRELVPSTPFKVGTVAAVKLAREEARTRRLQPGEEARLLAGCEAGKDSRGRPWRGNAGLKALIIAALETGCRQGELLSLQWDQVREDLFLPAGKTKAKKPRRVPISSVLRAVLDARALDPAGDRHVSTAYVFGDEIGRRRKSIKTSWRLTCKRANITGLHFHDLRREAGSRWMDAGVPLATIQRWLGHHNIAQTSTYLAASGGGDADAMRAFEEARGRVTQSDVFSRSTPQKQTSSSKTLSEKPNKNGVGRDRGTTIH